MTIQSGCLVHLLVLISAILVLLYATSSNTWAPAVSTMSLKSRSQFWERKLSLMATSIPYSAMYFKWADRFRKCFVSCTEREVDKTEKREN